MCKTRLFVLVFITIWFFAPAARSQDAGVRKPLDEKPPGGGSAPPNTKDVRPSSGADALLQQMAREQAAQQNEVKRQQQQEIKRQEAARRASEEQQRRYNSPEERAKRQEAETARQENARRQAETLRHELLSAPTVGFSPKSAENDVREPPSPAGTGAAHWPDPRAYVDGALETGQFIDSDQHGDYFYAADSTPIRVPPFGDPPVAYANHATKPTHMWDGVRWLDLRPTNGWFHYERTGISLIHENGTYYLVTEASVVELTPWEFHCRRRAHELIESMSTERYEYTFKLLEDTQRFIDIYVQLMASSHPLGRAALRVAGWMNVGTRLSEATSDEERMSIVIDAYEPRIPNVGPRGSVPRRSTTRPTSIPAGSPPTVQSVQPTSAPGKRDLARSLDVQSPEPRPSEWSIPGPGHPNHWSPLPPPVRPRSPLEPTTPRGPRRVPREKIPTPDAVVPRSAPAARNASPGSAAATSNTRPMAGAERQAEAIVNTRGGLVGKIEEHHVFPREFEGYFRDKGIDIHQYALPLDREAHKVAHAKGKHFEDWNQRWNKWIADNPGATEHQVFEQAGKMMDEYGLSFSPLKNYRRRR